MERELWSSGLRLVAGLDEVGRGALAGPVVAAAVILSPTSDSAGKLLGGVRDSKLLGPAARCRLYPVIIEVAAGVGVGAASPLAVDVLGIARATQLAMMRALAALPFSPAYLLLDGFPLGFSPLPQRAIKRGDRYVLSIAAASIVAKVTRDAEMIALGARLPAYGFDRHKGYGTALHREAIARHGPSVHHRLSWALLRDSPVRPATAERLGLTPVAWPATPSDGSAAAPAGGLPVINGGER